MNRIHLLSLAAFNANVQLAHWQANTLTNEHRTLGDFYDAFTELLDELAEVEIGRSGNTDFPAGKAVDFLPKANVSELLGFALETVDAIRAELTTPQDNDLGKILDEMAALINRTKFLLKV